MSQTTDQSRGRGNGSAPGKKTSGGLRRPGSTGASFTPAAPSPPRRKRPALTALAVLLIVGGAALAGLLAVRMDSRESVLVVNTKVTAGQRITSDMLTSTNVSGDSLKTISVDATDEVVDKLFARQTIYEGQLLQPELLRKQPPLQVDEAQVGVPLMAGKFPPDLRGGDAVRLVRIGDAQAPSQALAKGLVIEVSGAKSSGFGGESGASVATVIVPQSVADQVVGAAGTDRLGIALTGRGIGIDDADIADLSGGRN